jgi:hypothetical protein
MESKRDAKQTSSIKERSLPCDDEDTAEEASSTSDERVSVKEESSSDEHVSDMV